MNNEIEPDKVISHLEIISGKTELEAERQRQIAEARERIKKCKDNLRNGSITRKSFIELVKQHELKLQNLLASSPDITELHWRHY